MIGFKISDAKKLFFDTKTVISAKDRAEKKVLGRFGAFVRRDSRKSIRKRKSSSKPFSPPTNRTGLLKKFIFFIYDKTVGSVVIGPAKLNKPSTNLVPELLEYGGVITGKEQSIREKRTGKRDSKGRFGKSEDAWVTIPAGPRNYEPRPFMTPAFESNKEKHMPGMWKDSLR